MQDRRTKEDRITCSRDEVHKNTHRSSLPVSISEIGAHDADYERARVRRGLVSMFSYQDDQVTKENKVTYCQQLTVRRREAESIDNRWNTGVDY